MARMKIQNNYLTFKISAKIFIFSLFCECFLLGCRFLLEVLHRNCSLGCQLPYQVQGLTLCFSFQTLPSLNSLTDLFIKRYMRCLLVRPVARNFVLAGLILIEIKINGGLRFGIPPPPKPSRGFGALPTTKMCF